jgi:hypothetical protein
MADKDTDAKLDLIAGHIQKTHEGVDALREGHKALAARIDALEKGRHDSVDGDPEADRARRDGESDEDYAKRIDALDRAKADREAAAEERERADRVKRRMDSAERERQEFANRNAAAQAQMRADRAYQAWGLGQAPGRVHGESIRDFEIRLLQPLKQYSPRYKDAALELINDATVFADVADRVITDAVHASETTVVEGAPLRKITERNEAGHTITRWIGDPSVCWAPFQGGAVRLVKLNRPVAK